MKYFAGPADGEHDPFFDFQEHSSLEEAISSAKHYAEELDDYVVLKGDNKKDAIFVARVSVENIRNVKVKYANPRNE